MASEFATYYILQKAAPSVSVVIVNSRERIIRTSDCDHGSPTSIYMNQKLP